MSVAVASCGTCAIPFDGRAQIVKIKGCHHSHHESCFLEKNHIATIEEVVQRSFCPECDNTLLHRKKEPPKEDVYAQLKRVLALSPAPAAVVTASCGTCAQPFDGKVQIVSVKRCSHLHHLPCFLKKNHIATIGDVAQKSFCPECENTLLRRKKEPPKEDVYAQLRLMLKVNPPPAQAEPAESAAPAAQAQPSINVSHLKWITYFAIACICMTIGGVLYPSFTALGVGAAMTFPIGYFVGKKIDVIMCPA